MTATVEVGHESLGVWIGWGDGGGLVGVLYLLLFFGQCFELCQ